MIGASAIDPGGDLLDFDPEEVLGSRQILDAARSNILVADRTKFTCKAPVRIASLSNIDNFVTDGIQSESVATKCLDWQTNLVLV